MFILRSTDEVGATVRGRAAKYGDLPMPLAQRLATELERLTSEGNRLYELPDLRQTAKHDWGWVIGVDSFVEIVAIDRGSSTLTYSCAETTRRRLPFACESG